MPTLAGRLFVFLYFLSYAEDNIKKSPNPFGCDFQCIQKRLGFLFHLLILFMQRIVPLLPDRNRLFCGSQFFFQTLVVCIGDNAGVPATSSITFTGNTYDGAAWAEGMVIENTAVETIICSDNTRIDG